jgi:hypothetical protein
MNKIGIASVAAVVISGAAFAGFDSRNDQYIDGGNASVSGTFTGAQLAAMRGGVAQRNTSMYSTNWTNDSNGTTFTPGNVAPANSTTGPVYGQGNWAYYAQSGSGTNPSNYKINASATLAGRTGQYLTIGGAASASASRYLYQDVSAQWSARNAGDNIAWVAYDQYLGTSASASGSRNGGFLLGGNGTIGAMLTGMALETGTQGTATKQRSVFGYAYYTVGTASGNYRFKLSDQALSGGGTSPLAVSGGWTKQVMSFNQTTGEVNWYYSVDGGATYTGFFVNGAATGFNVLEWDFYQTLEAGATTTVGGTYGDLSIYATPAPGAAALVGLAGLMARRRRA